MVLFSKLRELEKKATPGPFGFQYHPEQWGHIEEKYRLKLQLAYEAMNALPKIFEVLDLYEEALKDIHEHFYGDGCDTADEALKRAKEIAGE